MLVRNGVLRSLACCTTMALAAVAVGVPCCLMTYSPISATPGSTVCGPGSTLVCEAGSTTVTQGKHFGQYRLQACYAYTLGPSDSYITGCGTAPAAGYVQLPGQVGQGKCCFVRASIRPQVINSATLTRECTEEDCEDHPANP